MCEETTKVCIKVVLMLGLCGTWQHGSFMRQNTKRYEKYQSFNVALGLLGSFHHICVSSVTWSHVCGSSKHFFLTQAPLQLLSSAPLPSIFNASSCIHNITAGPARDKQLSGAGHRSPICLPSATAVPISPKLITSWRSPWDWLVPHTKLINMCLV